MLRSPVIKKNEILKTSLPNYQPSNKKIEKKTSLAKRTVKGKYLDTPF